VCRVYGALSWSLFPGEPRDGRGDRFRLTCAVAFNPIQNFRFRYSARESREKLPLPRPDGRCVNSMAVAPRIHETGTVHGKNGIIMHGWPCDPRGTLIAGSALT
jgi:hypothetical protein